MKTRDWMDQGTRLLLATVDGLSDADFDAASALPGWTRRHVVAHVHYNAEALRRLLRWAATGEKTPMYASRKRRNAEIEEGSRLPVSELRTMVRESAEALARDLDALPDEAWRHEVETAQGRMVPATEIPWMRTREVAVHAVDLAAGVDFGDLPGDLLHALVEDVVARRVDAGEGPALARWLTGRAAHAPELGPWL
ncbi:maleylpyruvate isomerase N-terminal domain-containing protein [Amycolatopsis taiwanensis]|nr:maleylpyruvate isomerase N-terminal domain-containing protein [Amycolatopsis taiwanensis]